MIEKIDRKRLMKENAEKDKGIRENIKRKEGRDVIIKHCNVVFLINKSTLKYETIEKD